MTDWVALLDAMDQGLGSFPPVLLDPLPDDPGPIPPGLAHRVTHTLRRMAEVQAALEHEQADIARELAALAALKAAAPQAAASSVPQFLDTKA
jgi:hypothetical protein